MKQITKAGRQKRTIHLVEELKNNWQLWIMVIPLLVWLFFFALRPLYGVTIAFLEYSPFRGIDGSEWIGFENFKELMFGPS